MVFNRLPDHQFKDGLKILLRGAHLTSDLVKIQNEFRLKIEQGQVTPRYTLAYKRAYNFLTRQNQLNIKRFNALFERPA